MDLSYRELYKDDTASDCFKVPEYLIGPTPLPVSFGAFRSLNVKMTHLILCSRYFFSIVTDHEFLESTILR